MTWEVAYHNEVEYEIEAGYDWFEDETIYVISVFHTKQDPARWQARAD